LEPQRGQIAFFLYPAPITFFSRKTETFLPVGKSLQKRPWQKLHSKLNPEYNLEKI
jgi:hypothetical protein